MELKINDSWKVCSGNDDATSYHLTELPVGVTEVTLPCYAHMAMENHCGITWYQRKINIDRVPDENEIAVVSFERAEFFAEVSVNGKIVGTHAGCEDPFSFDITDVIKKGNNIITVRTSKPTDKEIDGYIFKEVPRGIDGDGIFVPGKSFARSGVSGEVSINYLPKVYIDDVYLKADANTGEIFIKLTAVNKTNANQKACLNLKSGKAPDGKIEFKDLLEANLSVGVNEVERIVSINNYELWSTDNPILYNVISELIWNGKSHTVVERTGFRNFEVKEDGFFYLNNKRIFLKSAHTGNNYPTASKHIAYDKEMIRKEFLMAKAVGFNMVRFIAGAALPVQLDLCDEIGLMIYEEPLAGWGTKNGPHAKENFRHDILSMIRRDRNHPCITIWGLLNETTDNGENTDLYEAGREILPELREIDETRLVIFSSGRWDGQLKNGSLCNPYNNKWEFLLNGDGTADRKREVFVSPTNGLKCEGYDGALELGDVHFYGRVPRPKQNIEFIRTLGSIYKRPVFLSETGIGSLLDTKTIINRYEQDGIERKYPDVKRNYRVDYFFNAELKKYGFDRLYPLVSELFYGSMINHAKYRAFDFSIIRSNPYINGVNLTGLSDHNGVGEGLFTVYRKYKPYIADVLKNGFAPLMWCIIPEKMTVFSGEDFKVEVLISHEDRLKTGRKYPVRAAIMKDGIVYEAKEYEVTVNDNKSFVVPVFKDNFSTDCLEDGEYTLRLEIDGADVEGDTKKFNVLGHRKGDACRDVYCIDVEREDIIEGLGYKIHKNDKVVLAGKITKDNIEEIKELLLSGATVVSLNAAKDDDITFELLCEDRRPVVDRGKDWVYHKEFIVNYESPFFKGMPAGVMDTELFGEIFTEREFWAEGKQVPDYTHSITMRTGDPEYAGLCSAGYKLATFNVGKGKLVVNSFDILKDTPMAERILINILDNA